MRHCKRLAISVIIMALCFSFLCPSSYALSAQQFSAWVAAAIQAINITVGSTYIPVADLGNRWNDFLNSPFQVETTQIVDLPYTYSDSDIAQYMSRSVLKVDKDSVTIDGVEYTDIWLSTDAAEKFRVNAFDIENAWDIASQSEGTFVSGVGYAYDVPMFQVGNVRRSQNYTHTGNGEYIIGGLTVDASGFNRNQQGQWLYPRFDILKPDGTTSTTSANARSSDRPYINYLSNDSGTTVRFNYQYYSSETGANRSGGANIGSGYVADPFDFDWVAGTLPADEPLTDEGLRIRVPTNDIQQWYQDYPDTGPNITINMGDPDLETKVDDLIDLIIPLIPYLDIDFVEYTNPEPEPQPEPIPDPDPYPDPDPQPGTVISDLDWSDLFETIKNIFNKIAEQVSISTAIKNLLDKIKWVLDDILDSIGDLVDKIVNGNTQWFQDIVDSIWNPFIPWFNIFKTGVGIWHYVVTWLQNIAAPFGFFFNVLASAGSIYVSPIYAVSAAAVVIAVYRRFGR